MWLKKKININVLHDTQYVFGNNNIDKIRRKKSSNAKMFKEKICLIHNKRYK